MNHFRSTAGAYLVWSVLVCVAPCQAQLKKPSVAAPAKQLTGEQKSRLKEAEKLNSRAIELNSLGKSREAVPLAKQTLAIRKEVLGENHQQTAESLNSLGLLLQAQGEYAAARPYLDQALKIRKKVLGDEHPHTAASLNSLGFLLQAQGDYAAARPHYEQALKINRKVLGDEHPETARQLNNIGFLLQAQGENAAARPYFEQAIKINRKVLGDEHPHTAASLNNLGLSLQAQGDYAGARPNYEQALKINRKVLGEEHHETAKQLNNLGLLLQAQGDYAAARPYYEQALKINRKVLGDEHPETARQLHNLGFLLGAQGDYAAARPYFEQAIKINRKVLGDEHPHTAASLNSLGVLLKAQGDYAAAGPYCEQALQIRKKVLGNEHPDTAMSLHTLGALMNVQGDYAAARLYYEQALQTYRKVLGDEHPDTAVSLSHLGFFEGDNKNWSVAESLFDTARRGVRRHIARVLPALSEREQTIFLQQTDERTFHGALSLGFVRRGDASLADASAGWLLNGKAVAQTALAERALLTRDQKDPTLARSVHDLTDVRRRLAALVMAAPKTGQEAARREQISDLTRQEEELSRRLSAAAGQASRPDPWIELEEIRSVLPAGSVLIEFGRFDAFNFQARGKEKRFEPARYAAWIIPRSGDVVIIDLGPADVIDRAIDNARQSLILVAAKTTDLKTRGEAEVEREARADLQVVTHLVWKPLSDKLGGAKQLFLSPDASLWLVPWAALAISDDRFLIEEYSLTYLISGRDLVTQRQAAKITTSKPVVMANPNFDLTADKVKAAIKAVFPKFEFPKDVEDAVLSARSALPKVARLPGTATEAEAIKPSIEKYTGTAPQMYVDQYALESLLKQVKRPRLAVISTHGFFLPDQEVKHDERLLSSDTRAVALTVEGKPIENPLLRCGLLLAGCNAQQSAAGDDGILTGMEIVGIDLRGTELVVLSACETGVGQVRNGEGVAGLRQAFQLAGAQSVVSTLWQVPDKESTLLMNDFFANLAAGQSKSEALRNAQLKRISSRRDRYGAAHPYFWAAWTVTGK